MQGFIIANDPVHYEAAKSLFREYADSLEIDLCFQNFEKELHNISEVYDPVNGGIILFSDNGNYAGCIAIRKIDNKTCELKRMFVQPSFRGKGIAKELLRRAIEMAREKGYKTMRLDTLTTMTSAISLYRANGFYEIPAYYHNPEKNVLYLEVKL